jgi:hypothetical protein
LKNDSNNDSFYKNGSEILQNARYQTKWEMQIACQSIEFIYKVQRDYIDTTNREEKIQLMIQTKEIVIIMMQ